MLTILNTYAHGYVAIPILNACKKYGLFDLLKRKSSLSIKELHLQLNANDAYLRIALHALESLKWVVQNDNGDYSLTSEAVYDDIPSSIMELYDFPLEDYLSGNNANLSLQPWINIFIRPPDYRLNLIDKLLQGILFVPLLINLQKYKLHENKKCDLFFFSLPQTNKDELMKIFFHQNWLINTIDGLQLTPVGTQLLERAYVMGIAASYKPMLRNIEEIIFGDYKKIFTRNADLSENHIDRTINVIASGIQHDKYFKDAEDIILDIFNKMPFEKQPKYIADMGCGDGNFLKQIYSIIKDKSARGKALSTYPLTLIGIDYNQKALIETEKTLSDIPHFTLHGDINKPSQLLNNLQLRSIDDIDSILHVRSFLDHNRKYTPPKEIRHNSLISYSGTYVDQNGQTIPPCLLIDNLSEHLESWNLLIGKHGLLILESHSLAPNWMQDYFEQTESFYFDTIHAFSEQYLVDAEKFMMAAARVGLFPIIPPAKYPKTLPFTRITLNHLEKRNYVIRYAELKDLQILKELEKKCWSAQLQVSEKILQRRLIEYPEGQLVLVLEEKVVGVIYSQRIDEINDLLKISFDEITKLHKENGKLVQLLAINILPEMQQQNLGDQLLEFMLQRCTIMNGVHAVVGVTRCRNYNSSIQLPIDQYIYLKNKNGWLEDPILRFHQLHGAQIVSLIPNYRPQDSENLGFGVLIKYDLQNRQNIKSQLLDNVELLSSQSNVVSNFPQIETFIIHTVNKLLGNSLDSSIDKLSPLMEMGLDSADLLELSVQISYNFQLRLEPTFFFQYKNIEQIITYLKEKFPEENESISIAHQKVNTTHLDIKKVTSEISASSRNDIAIIGIACRFPGAINSLDDLWQLLSSNKSAIGDLPKERWQTSLANVSLADYPGINKGGFLDDISCFDAAFFRISPKEAELMDPQQRIMLELAWHAIEDAGYSPRYFSGTDTAVIIGASGSDYNKLLEKSDNIEAHFSIGTALSVIPNRISYYLDLHGPSVQIDTACSSSLVAINHAIKILQAKESKHVLVGGINIICHPGASIAYYKAGMLSKDGICKTFDKSANGYVRSEGAAILLLKPLELAIQDDDHIYAVIRGSATNHGGQASGLTVPNPDSQKSLIIKAYENAGILPETVEYIEVHGTGTPLGDPIEVTGLKDAFSTMQVEKKQIEKPWCGLGSIKTNLGHLEAAAGIAGLLKVVACLQHKELPATLNFETLNPHISLQDTPFYIVNHQQTWNNVDGNLPRRASISSFGSGGTNAHVVLEEYVEQRASVESKNQGNILVFSAKTPERLHANILFFIEYIKSKSFKIGLANNANQFVDNICYTLQVGREAMTYRAAFYIKEPRDMQEKLNAYINGDNQIDDFFQGHLDEKNEISKILNSDEDINNTIDVWIKKGKYQRLMKLWVKGLSLDWNKLYEKQKPHRISLPGYCFSQEHYWLQERQKDDTDLAAINELSNQTDLTGNVMLLPVWEITTPTPAQMLPNAAEKILMIGGTIEDESNVRALYPQVIKLKTKALFDIVAMSEQLKKIGIINHIIWIAPLYDLNLAGDALDGKQLILDVYTFIKVLLLLDYANITLGLTFVTENAQAVSKHAVINPMHAALHGLVGVIAKEYPNWKIRLVDRSSGDQEIYQKIFTLPPDIAGNAWLCRDQVWYRQQLIHMITNNSEPNVLYKANGVYVVIGGAGGIGEAWSEYMIRNYQAHIIWIGRREKNKDIEQKINKLSAFGPSPQYIVADASDKQMLQIAYGKIKKQYSSINGIVHSAVGLLDQSIFNMDTSSFSQGLAAKMDISILMAEIFGNEPLDFVLFFSSMLSITKDHGKSSYATGSTFEDAFAHYLSLQWPCPVKVINWGYWGNLGIGDKVPQSFKNRMKHAGIGPVDPSSAMHALNVLLTSAINQMVFVNIEKSLAIDAINITETITIYPENRKAITPDFYRQDFSILKSKNIGKLKGGLVMSDMSDLLLELLWVQLHAAGLLSLDSEWLAIKNVSTFYNRWIEESLCLLAGKKYLENENDKWKVLVMPDAIHAWQKWDTQKVHWLHDIDCRAQAILVEACLRKLPDILNDKIMATDVIFPDATMALVEGVYRNNAIADYFNDVVANAVVNYVKTSLATDKTKNIRMLEIGAGTGGTSERVMRSLKPYEKQITEYCYTDVSKAFLFHAEKTYGVNYSYLTYKLFDVSAPLAGQEIEAGGYDIVLATNVLHATGNIRQTLRNAKAVLKKNGILILNEINGKSLFTHLTFGLLEGWWLHEDSELRISGCPGLYPKVWEQVLFAEGFEQVIFPVPEAHAAGQQIIIAVSDGVVRQANREKYSNNVIEQKEFIQIKQASIDSNACDQIKTEQLYEKCVLFIKKIVSDTLKIPMQQINPDESLEVYGIDSILIAQLNKVLRETFNNISSTLFFEHQTINALANYFFDMHKETLVKTLKLEPEKAEFKSHQPKISFKPLTEKSPEIITSSDPQESIAIIGISGRYPQANDLQEYWENLKAGKDCITEIPPDRWSLDGFYEADKKVAVGSGKSYSKWGGFIDSFAEFDPLFFNISPREAMTMDPQERLFLQTCWEVLEDAGYTKEQLVKTCNRQVGVFVGITKTGYELYGPELWKRGEQLYPHTSFSSVANRVSYILNLQGPSMPVDTMCSSSLTAIHEACEHLLQRDCEMALAGGVNLYLHPSNYVKLSALQMLATGKQCKSFGEGGDGFVPGEGVGVVLLKRLSQAIADNDHIYAVIRGTSINHGGKTNGYTVPNPVAQANLVRAALNKAGINARSISYIEAHGTGTALGDPIEIAGLTQAFQNDTPDMAYCAIGSVKPNIGHLESAAGIAGLTKVVLQMQHQLLVPSLYAQELNSHIDFSRTPFVVQQELGEWRQSASDRTSIDKNVCPKVACILSFGAGGSNACVVIEEFSKNFNSQTNFIVNKPVIILLSAKDDKKLKEIARLLLRSVNERKFTNDDLLNIAYTLQIGREAMFERVAILVNDLNELENKLHLFVNSEIDEEIEDLYRGNIKDTLRILSADDDLSQLVTLWMAKKKYHKLSELWVNGLNIDWEKLYDYETVKPRRISLPTYPFARERYWIRDVIDDKAIKLPVSVIKDNIAKDEPYKLLTFEERWEPTIFKSTVTTVQGIICFVSSKQDQQIISQQVKLHLPEAKLIFIVQDKDYNKVTTKQYNINRAQPQHYEKIFSELPSDFSVDSIWYLWPLEETACKVDARPIVFLLQALHRTSCNPQNILLAAPADTTVEQCYTGSWIGFERSLGLILPTTRVACVYEESERANINIWAERLSALCTMKDVESTLYRGNETHVLRIRQTEVIESNSLFRSRGTYLITGGCGELGLKCAEYIASIGESIQFILNGRSPLNATQQARLEQLKAQGHAIFYLQADVCDVTEMQAGIKKAKAQFGAIHGVLHAAGKQGKEILWEKDISVFEEVLAPKIIGTQVLDEVLVEEPLEFICYFSSAAAILGDFGSCDYALGNRFLMAYGHYRNDQWKKGEKQGKAIVINWPLWKEGGMHMANEAGSQLYLKSSGQRLLETEEGLTLFNRLLSQRHTQHLVLAGQLNQLKRYLKYSQSQEMTDQTTEATRNDRNQTAIPQQTSLSGYSLEERVRADLKKQISQLLHIPVEKIVNDINLADLGFDSISLSSLAYALSSYYGLSITPSLFFVHSTPKHLVSYFMNTHTEILTVFYNKQDQSVEAAVAVPTHIPLSTKAPAHIPSLVTSHPTQQTVQIENKEPMLEGITEGSNEPIAIIGMSGRFPQARTVDEFWQLLVEGKEAITEIPADRFDWRTCYGDAANDATKSNSKWLGSIPGVGEFDTGFFGISPREAKHLDPRQRLLLQESWRALEDAGYGKRQLENNRVGVYIGVEQGDYGSLGNESVRSNVTANHEGILASRLSYFLDLDGPVLAINTACSSGLVAIHQACMSLRNQECDVAIAGGVSLTLSPEMFIGMAQAGMLSSEGKCYAFDERANGIVPGEAVAVVVLKRLSQAIKDGDPIDAVIKGSGINYDGKTNGITAPNGGAQTKLVESVYKRYCIDPEKIEYVVTHGTGTKLGDPVEVNALIEAYRHFTNKTRYCALTSPKSNVGHTFAASGVVGLISLVQSLRHGIIPASLNCKEENRYVEWEGSPFYVNKAKKEWAANDGVRLGAVSAFGMSGTNVHMVVESYSMPKVPVDRPSFYLLVLSAKNEIALREKVSSMLAYLSENTLGDEDLPSLSYTLLDGRQLMEYRCAIVVENIASAIKGWSGFLRSERLSNLLTGQLEKGFEIDINQEKLGNEKIRRSAELLKDSEVYRSELMELAQLYCRGYELDWSGLYAEKTPTKIHLPTYPFAKQGYWINTTSTKQLHDKPTEIPLQILSKNELKLQNKNQNIPSVISLLPLDGEVTNFVAKKEVEPHKINELDFTANLTMSLSEILDISISTINLDTKFIDLGLDSIVGVEWVRKINKQYGLSLQATKLYDYPSINEFADFLRQELNKNNEMKPLNNIVVCESGQCSLEKELIVVLASMLDLNESDIDSTKSFVDLGMDSIIGVEWVRAINNKYSVSLPAARIYDYPNIRALAEFLQKELESTSNVDNEVVSTGKISPSIRKILQDVQMGKLDIELANEMLSRY